MESPASRLWAAASSNRPMPPVAQRLSTATTTPEFLKSFYDAQRAGKETHTSQITPHFYTETFAPLLAAGQSVLSLQIHQIIHHKPVYHILTVLIEPGGIFVDGKPCFPVVGVVAMNYTVGAEERLCASLETPEFLKSFYDAQPQPLPYSGNILPPAPQPPDLRNQKSLSGRWRGKGIGRIARQPAEVRKSPYKRIIPRPQKTKKQIHKSDAI